MHSPTSIAAERVSEPTRRRADYGEVSAAIPLSRRNLPGLDGVRGLAILAVMLTHISLQTIALNPMLRGLFALGWSGVDLFFVLSGFLITGILLDTRQCANYFRSFYARRVLRIFPLYFGFLTVALLVFPYVVSPEFMPAPSHRWMYVCYVANWLPHAQWHVLTHFWSLCVEEQFYFIWPLVVLLFGPRRLLPLIAGLELTMVCGRSWWLLTHSHVATQYTATVARVDGLLLGAACAVLVRQVELPGWSIRALPGVALLFLAAFVIGYHRLARHDRHLFTHPSALPCWRSALRHLCCTPPWPMKRWGGGDPGCTGDLWCCLENTRMEFTCFIIRSSILPRDSAGSCRIPFITRFGSPVC